jgi:hypothetical protein
MKRALWLIPAALLVAADPAQEVLDLFTGLAASLSANDAQQFMAAFDREMPGYDKLRQEVTALVGPRAGNGVYLTEIASYVDVVSDEGDAQHRTVEVDWRMRVKRRGDAVSAPREQRLQCKLEKRGKKWKIVSLTPLEFFVAQARFPGALPYGRASVSGSRKVPYEHVSYTDARP